MKTLYLLRHAKSSWDDASLDDHERPLTARGIRAAGQIGRTLKERGATIDLALCSTARRASETARIVLETAAPDVVVERERGLYLCGAATLLARLRDAPDTAASLLIVAHNPDMHNLARTLVGEAPYDKERELAADFPTAALAILLFEAPRWADLEVGGGRLVDFIVPRKGD